MKTLLMNKSSWIMAMVIIISASVYAFPGGGKEMEGLAISAPRKPEAAAEYGKVPG